MDNPQEHSKMHWLKRNTTYEDLERFLTQTMKSGSRDIYGVPLSKKELVFTK